MNNDVVVDNIMFQFLTDDENFNNIMSYNHRTVVSPSKIPLSPNRGKHVTPQLRTSQCTDSTIIHSLASSQLRIPNLLDSEFS